MSEMTMPTQILFTVLNNSLRSGPHRIGGTLCSIIIPLDPGKHPWKDGDVLKAFWVEGPLSQAAGAFYEHRHAPSGEPMIPANRTGYGGGLHLPEQIIEIDEDGKVRALAKGAEDG